MKPTSFFLIFIFGILLSCSQQRTEKFDLSQLPRNWVHLTETDSGLVVYNSCDAGNLLISFNNKSEILFHGQQEDYEFEILKTLLTENDSVDIVTNWKGTTNKQVFKFHWIDKEKGLIRLASSSPSKVGDNFVFVNQEQQSEFPSYDQPCIECWPEEECD